MISICSNQPKIYPLNQSIMITKKKDIDNKVQAIWQNTLKDHPSLPSLLTKGNLNDIDKQHLQFYDEMFDKFVVSKWSTKDDILQYVPGKHWDSRRGYPSLMISMSNEQTDGHPFFDLIKQLSSKNETLQEIAKECGLVIDESPHISIACDARISKPYFNTYQNRMTFEKVAMFYERAHSFIISNIEGRKMDLSCRVERFGNGIKPWIALGIKGVSKDVIEQIGNLRASLERDGIVIRPRPEVDTPPYSVNMHFTLLHLPYSQLDSDSKETRECLDKATEKVKNLLNSLLPFSVNSEDVSNQGSYEITMFKYPDDQGNSVYKPKTLGEYGQYMESLLESGFKESLRNKMLQEDIDNSSFNMEVS